MAKFRQIKTDFAAGELSPRAYGRIDLTDIYPKAARKLQNWVVTPQGGAYYRHGFAYIGNTSSASYVLPRIFTVSRGGVDDDLILELGFQPGNTNLDAFATRLLRVEFYTVVAGDANTVLTSTWDTGAQVSVPQTVEVPAQGFSFAVMAQAADVTVTPTGTGTIPVTNVPAGTNTVFVWNGTTWGVTPDYVPLTAYARVWRADSGGSAITLAVPPVTTRDLLFMTNTQKGRLMVFAMPDNVPLYLQFNSDWSLATWTQLPNGRVPLQQFKDEKSPGAVDSEVDIQFGPTPAWNNNDNFWVSVNGVTEARTIFGSPIQPWTYPYSTDVPTMTNRLLQAFRNNPEVAYDQVQVVHQSGTVWRITLNDASSSVDIASGWVGSGTEKTTNITINSVGSNAAELAWSFPTVVLEGSNYYQAIQPNQGQQPPNATYWTDLGTTAPVWFAWQYPSGNAWDTNTFYGVGNRGFPRAATFHDQRLVLGGSADAPLQIWGSRIDDYDLFVTGTVNDDDPWGYTLDSMDSPEVQFLTSNKGLFCGSTNGDFIINADVTITPTDIFAARQTARRAALAKPEVLGNEVFYIQNGGTKIRRSAYVRDSDGFRTEDFTLLAEHLFRNPAIRLAKSVSPETFLWALNDQGELRGCTYDRFAGVQAWTPYVTDGLISDITGAFLTLERGVGDPQFSAGIDNLVVIVQRFAEGRYQWFIEAMPYPSFRPERGSYQTSVHADSYVEFFHSPAATGSEAKNLEEREVRLIGIPDGETELRDYGLITVPTGGNIVYPTALTYAAYGLPYVAEGETMEVAYSGSAPALGTERRWNKLWTQVVDSYLPEIKTSETGQYQRQPENADGSQYVVGQPLPPKRTDEVRYQDTGYYRGIIFFRHDRPVPCHITGLFGEVGINEPP